MSGQLVIAELDAFRGVLGKVQPLEGETVTVWCRSTIANALHRVGPTGPMNGAAKAAWTAAEHFASRLDDAGDNQRGTDAIEQARDQALHALDALIAAVRAAKAASPDQV
ncbi:hypothetical protein [Beijerinckia sp. L45]|uniref:hypothetical protein n=1 Tax=Beijerinckia sp. L45 TaxID=1641855 RepID=UPI00131E8B99|nr:hypothetical protein [Beijerinckia sp. L45]